MNDSMHTRTFCSRRRIELSRLLLILAFLRVRSATR